MTAINGVHDPTIIEHEGTFIYIQRTPNSPKRQVYQFVVQKI